MKRHLQTPAPVPTPIPTLSNEELAILDDEASESAIAADAAAADAERVTEVAEVANDAVLVVDETPEIGQVESELIGAVGDMAVAGTDADPMEVISVAAPTEGEDLSVEGIVSALKSIWNAIITAIRNMWVGLKHWLTTYFSTLEQNKKHAERLIERLNGMKGYLANGGAELTSFIADIFNYSGSSWLDLFNQSGQQNEKLCKYILETTQTQHLLMTAIGQGLEEGYNQYDGMNVDALGDVVNKLGIGLSNYIKRIGLTHAKGDGFESDTIANMKVIVKGFSENFRESGNNIETNVALVSKVRFSVDQKTEFSTTKGRVMKNDTTPEMILASVKERLVFIEALLKFKNDQFTQLEATLEKVEKACDGMLGRIKEDNKEGMAFAKRLMPLTTAFSNWATQPTAKLLDVAARHNKFFLSFYEMATNNFKEA